MAGRRSQFINFPSPSQRRPGHSLASPHQKPEDPASVPAWPSDTCRLLQLPVCDRTLRGDPTSLPPHGPDSVSRSTMTSGAAALVHWGRRMGGRRGSGQRVQQAPHLKKSWDRRVRSAGRHCGTGLSRAECKVCRKLRRASTETEIQRTVSSGRRPPLRASLAGD